jgi:hypothetical protein
MLPVSLDCRFVFLHLVYLLCCQFLWIVVLFFFTLSTPTKRQSRETGNIEGTQDEEKQNDNPEKLAT